MLVIFLEIVLQKEGAMNDKTDFGKTDRTTFNNFFHSILKRFSKAKVFLCVLNTK